MDRDHEPQGPLWSDPARLLLWPGHGLYLGRLLPNDAHAHHAVQVTAALTGQIQAWVGADPPTQSDVVVVGADHVHALRGQAHTMQLYLDPASVPGRALTHGGDAARHDIETHTRAALPTLRHLWRTDAPIVAWQEPISRIWGTGTRGHQSRTHLDERVTAALASIHQAPTHPPTLAQAADDAALSSSRFAHLFTEHVGLPYRRYLLWTRLIAAIAARAAGGSLTTVAHGAGFADSAHLARTFRRMFGMMPSTLLNSQVRIEVDLAGWAPAPPGPDSDTCRG